MKSDHNAILRPKVGEVNSWSVTWGVMMAVLFSAAAAYLGLKVGQVFEAAIPIAIIAVDVPTAAKRSNALRENVIIQSIGACSGAGVADAIFTLPAIYILQAKYPEMSTDFLKIFIASLLGGVLGILFLIPFRKYFVEAPQEQFPFPEATATTQVLKSGNEGASQAKPLLFAGLVGRLYDFIKATFGWCNENVTIYDSELDGEYLAWHSKNVRLVNCHLAGEQLLCYAQDLVLENCTIDKACDRMFEYSTVEADIRGHIENIKNPTSGHIVADSIGSITIDEYVRQPNDCVIEVRSKGVTKE
ncbi:MAG: OPT/YSL family transporter [Prevotella sp.]|nr:OPT/YSL family transporter [Prevotella sp.]